MLEEDYENTVMEKGRYFLLLLQGLEKKYPEIGNVDGLGLALRIEICTSDGITPDRGLTEKLFLEGLQGNLTYQGSRYGLVLDIGGYYKNVLTLAPSLLITKSEIEMAVELLDQLMSKCR